MYFSYFSITITFLYPSVATAGMFETEQSQTEEATSLQASIEHNVVQPYDMLQATISTSNQRIILFFFNLIEFCINAI